MLASCCEWKLSFIPLLDFILVAPQINDAWYPQASGIYFVSPSALQVCNQHAAIFCAFFYQVLINYQNIIDSNINSQHVIDLIRQQYCQEKDSMLEGKSHMTGIPANT